MPNLISLRRWWSTFAGAGALATAMSLAVALSTSEARGPLAAKGNGCPRAVEHTLPLPSTVPPAQFVDFEKQVLAFLQSGEYKALGWCDDKGSPCATPGRSSTASTTARTRGAGSTTRRGDAVAHRWPPGHDPRRRHDHQGAVPPAGGPLRRLTDDQLPHGHDWTVMIKDATGAKDGWFWGEFFDGMTFDDDKFPVSISGGGVRALLPALPLRRPRRSRPSRRSTTSRAFRGSRSRSPTTARGGGRGRRRRRSRHARPPSAPCMPRAASPIPDFLQTSRRSPACRSAQRADAAVGDVRPCASRRPRAGRRSSPPTSAWRATAG